MNREHDRHGIGMTSQRTRERLIQRLYEEGLSNAGVLEVIRRTPRHLFVDEALAHRAYEDTALPIGHNQTISQPYMVARMSELLLAAGPLDKVLEIGTGSGYVTALLDQLGAGAVLSLERYRTLAEDATARLGGREEVRIVHADALAPALPDGGFDRILVNGCVASVPEHWLAALEPDGRLVTGLAIGHIATFTPDGACETGPALRLPELVPGLARVL